MPKRNTQNKPGHYYGSKYICERLGISNHTLYKWIVQKGLPVYERYFPNAPGNVMWYSNEFLLSKWERMQADKARLKLVERRRRNQEKRVERERERERQREREGEQEQEQGQDRDGKEGSQRR